MTVRTPSIRRRPALVALGLVAVLVLPVGCGGDDGDDGGGGTTTTEATGTSDGTSTTTEAEGGTSTTSVDEATSTTEAAAPLPDASLDPRSAEADGTGIALLTDVRIGRNDGFERIVFEFEGTSVPGYRVGWVDPPITADASGEPVAVDGDAFLEIVMTSASGVDLSGPEFEVIYEGPERLGGEQTELIEELVRTGDFEAVLSWVAGTTEQVPFRVLTLASPTRVVVDLATA